MSERKIIAYGTVSAKGIFSSQPDSGQLHQGLIRKVAKTIEDDIGNANRQIRDTKLIFGIPNAKGITVFLNEGAKTLTPDVVAYSVHTTLQKRTPDGGLRYSQSDGVIVISEAEPLPVEVVPVAFPISVFFNKSAKSATIVSAFSEMLIDKWAAYNFVPVLAANR